MNKKERMAAIVTKQKKMLLAASSSAEWVEANRTAKQALKELDDESETKE